MKYLLDGVKKKLNSEEEMLFTISCSLDLKGIRHRLTPGVLISTNKRLFFYSRDIMGDEWMQDYFYENLLDVKEQKNLFGVTSILFLYKNERVAFRNVASGNPTAIVQKIRGKVIEHSKG
ncbi:hypothetical protein BK704_09355 [[Bacillus thuringiensis] serovar konkukian]|nr:PH domain-containing protein [Bacillus thuringiensis]MED1305249.1 PH domain-containing protein [Bacillus pacificus]OUB14301.1 hypothetical protein BK704_09355 [[Bacillus thuringiensis] serovar konkukian]